MRRSRCVCASDLERREDAEGTAGERAERVGREKNLFRRWGDGGDLEMGIGSAAGGRAPGRSRKRRFLRSMTRRPPRIIPLIAIIP
jgi:hypothetical protein